MLSQARGFLSPGSIFKLGSSGGQKNNDSTQQGELETQTSSSSKSKSKASKLNWKIKRKAAKSELTTSDKQNPTSVNTNLSGDRSHLQSNRHQQKDDLPKALQPLSLTPSSSSSSHHQQQRQGRRQNQSSPSCDLSSGYLSQTNGAASSSMKLKQAENTDNNQDTNDNENMLYTTQNVPRNNNRNYRQTPLEASNFHLHQNHHHQHHSQAQARPAGEMYHSHSFASSTTLTRLPLVPMMIDDEDEVQQELEFDGENDDDDDEQNLAADGAEFDFERHQQSYQLMIDGLKRRQLQQRRRQLQQQQRFVQHQCQQDDKLSLMMLYNGNHGVDDSDHHHRHLSLPADECADSESISSNQMVEYQLDDEADHRHLTSLAYALGADRNSATRERNYKPRFATVAPHLTDETFQQFDDRRQHRQVLNSASFDHNNHYDTKFRAPRVIQANSSSFASFNPADPDQRRPTLVYYQPDIVNTSEHYAKLNNHLQNHSKQRLNPIAKQNQRHISSSFLHDRHPLKQTSRSSTTHSTINAKQENTSYPPRLPPKVAGHPPQPPARDLQIRGRLHQTGQPQPNLASPGANQYNYEEQEDHDATASHRRLAVSKHNTQAHLAPQQTMITSSSGSRQHLTSPNLSPNQQQIRRIKSNHQSQSGRQQIVSSISGTKQQHLHQQTGPGVRSVPKSTVFMNGPAVASIGMAQSGGQMSPNLAAISNGSRGLDSTSMGCCGKLAKFLLFIANILFWCAGVALGAWGILALVEDHKYNLSQLLVFEPNSRMSLFQLLAWSFITLGGATILIGVCGCSAMFKNSRWILGLYIFLILAIFALDLATGLLAIIFQERLVANVRLRLVSKLRNEYGIQASFTAAIDYIQTRYECCGLDGHFDYEQSLWRLQRLGGFEATVARTCCHLRNTLDDQAHVNPRPVNESMCQSTDVRFHQSYRFRRGCLDDLERLIRHKIWTFTIGCGIVGAIILMVLALATCFCRSISNSTQNNNNNNNNGSSNNRSSNSSSSRKNRVHQQALLYAETVAKKQGHHQHHPHGHHSHHSSSASHHK